MTTSKNLLSLGWILALNLSVLGTAQAQVRITSRDMFNQIGQYYRAYANKGSVSVSGKLGVAGGPQVWDFTTGPTDQIYRFDYVAVNDAGHGSDFTKANFAERKTEEATGARNWLYLEQVPGLGRRVYGFYDSDVSPNNPSIPFSDPIIDFPDTINYKDSWKTSTSYTLDIPLTDSATDPTDPTAPPESISIPVRFNDSSTFTVDAYGILNLPGVSFSDALRVNELVQHDAEVDLDGNGNFQPITTEFSRNYYWLRPGLGIAAQANSKEQTTPPPDNFTTATSFVRLFESNHSKVQVEPPPVGITGLKISVGSGSVLINWNKMSNASSYRVEYTTNPAAKDSWQKLGAETTSNFMIDSAVNGAPTRFYRIVAVN